MGYDEQSTYTACLAMFTGGYIRVGQRKTISNRRISKLRFLLRKYGSPPTGNVTFAVRRVSDDSIILSKVWGDASDLPTSITYEEVTFDTPVLVNEEVRLYAEYSGGDYDNCVEVAANQTDVKAGEYICVYETSWLDEPSADGAYRVSWVQPWAGKISGVTNPAKVMGIAVADIAKVKGRSS